MKILFCFPGWGRSGGARVVGEYCNRLIARGHQVFIYSQDGRMPDWFDLKAVAIRLGAAQHQKWDVVVATNPTTVIPALSINVASKHVYFVQMWESLFFKPGTSQHREALSTYHRAVDRGMMYITIAEWLKDRIKHCGAETVHVVGNGVNRDHFYPVSDDSRGEYILIEGDSRNEAKDTERIGWRVAQWLRSNYGIKLVGVGASKNEMTAQLDEFVMNPSLDDYRRLYSGAKFMLKASKFEGRSLAPLEAMVCGTPSCRAIISGDDDLLTGHNCIRTNYNYDELLLAASMLMEDEQVLNSIKRGAQMLASKGLQWGPIITAVEDLFLYG